MKIFLTIQKNFKVLGIDSDQSIQNTFTIRSLISFYIFGCAIVMYFIYIFCEANGYAEYERATLDVSLFMVIDVVFVVNIFGMKNISKFIVKLEIIIKKSKSIFLIHL